MVDSKTPDTMNTGTALKIIAERLKKIAKGAEMQKTAHRKICSCCKYRKAIEGYDWQWGMKLIINNYCTFDGHCINEERPANSHFMVECGNYEAGDGEFVKYDGETW